MSLEEYMKRQLDERDNKGILRSLRLNDTEIDFYSNDYLSLAALETVLPEHSAAGSSRLIAGNTQLHEELETKFANFVGRDTGLLFNSGYTANMGVLSSIPQKDDIILFDELSHASIKDGIRLSHAKGIRFKHNNIGDLERKLKANQNKRCFVITEGLFSMDGIYGDISAINERCKKFNAHLIVDEAHSGGTVDKEGKGICATLGIKPFITIYTLGKAFGSHGAVVTCSETCKNFLINFSRPFIYTTSLPQSILKRSIEILKGNTIRKRVLSLHEVVERFNSIFENHEFVSDPNSPIKIFIPKDQSDLKKIEKMCLENGIGIKAIYPPTVPEGKSCLRISLHALQTESDLKALLSVFNQVLS